MSEVTSAELYKVVDFVNSCNDMIDGKFILADVKIRKILNIIEESEILYKYISNCMAGFNFERELQRAEVKNTFNGGQFVLPQDKNTMVALVFCLLFSFDTKKIDFYQFIKQNFDTLTPNGEYASFAKNMLVPFRDAIGNDFKVLNVKKEDVKNLHVEDNFLGNNNYQEQEIEEDEEETEEQQDETDVFDEIAKTIDALIEKVYTERKLKEEQKQKLLYVLKSTKYCLRYKDIKLVSAYVTCFDDLVQKVRSLQFLLMDLKSTIKNYYDNNL